MDEINSLIEGTDLSVHVVVPGSEQDVAAMKQELGLNYDVLHSTDMALHQSLKMTVTEGGRLYALRGYSIVKKSKLLESHEMVEIGELSVDLVKEALNK